MWPSWEPDVCRLFKRHFRALESIFSHYSKMRWTVIDAESVLGIDSQGWRFFASDTRLQADKLSADRLSSLFESQLQSQGGSGEGRLNFVQWMSLLVQVAFHAENPTFQPGDPETSAPFSTDICVERMLLERVIPLAQRDRSVQELREMEESVSVQRALQAFRPQLIALYDRLVGTQGAQELAEVQVELAYETQRALDSPGKKLSKPTAGSTSQSPQTPPPAAATGDDQMARLEAVNLGLRLRDWMRHLSRCCVNWGHVTVTQLSDITGVPSAPRVWTMKLSAQQATRSYFGARLAADLGLRRLSFDGFCAALMSCSAPLFGQVSSSVFL